MTQEDFTTWTETGVVAHLSQTPDRSTWTGLLRTDDNTYLYKNKSGDLQSFTYYFKLRITAIDNSSSTIRLMLDIVQSLDDYYDNRIGNKTQFGIQIRSNSSDTQFYYYLAETYAGYQYLSTQGAYFNKNVDYYIKIVKSGTSFAVYWYSDAGYTNLLDSKALTLHANHNLPYMMMPQAMNMNTAVGTSGYVENLRDSLVDPGSADLNAEFTVRGEGSGNLKAIFGLYSSGSIDLYAKFAVNQGIENLKGIFIIRQDSSAALKGVFIVRHASSAALKVILIIRHSSTTGLKGIFSVRNASSVDLKGVFIVRHASSADLKGIFIARHTATKDLYARFEAQSTINLKGIFSIGSLGSWDLKGIFIIRQDSTKDLYANFIVKQGTKDLYAKLELAQWEDLYAKFEVTHSADLYAKFELAQWKDLKGIFISRLASAVALKGVFIVRHSRFVPWKIHCSFVIIRTPVPLQLPAEFLVTRPGSNDLMAIFATSTVNASPVVLKSIFYVRPGTLMGEGFRIRGWMKTDIRVGGVETTIKGGGRASIKG